MNPLEKLRSVITHKLIGECPINLEKIADVFDKKCAISKWNDEYRLFRATKRGVQLKVTISSFDALKIIDSLNLKEVKSSCFNHASTFYPQDVEVTA